MEWKAKIVEDDVKFRTESELARANKTVDVQNTAIEAALEATMMEKGATEAALKDAGAKLAQREHAFAMSEQEIW